MTWQLCALASAFFAALTAILAKVGVSGVNSNLATAVRTVVILIFAWAIVLAQGSYREMSAIATKTWVFLILSGLATGASWLFYFQALKLGPASRVAPLDKMSVPLAVLLAVVFLHEPLTWKVALGAGMMTGGALLLLK
jgi:transporter family protein